MHAQNTQRQIRPERVLLLVLLRLLLLVLVLLLPVLLPATACATTTNRVEKRKSLARIRKRCATERRQAVGQTGNVPKLK